METKRKKVNIKGIENVYRKYIKFYKGKTLPIIGLPESNIEPLKNELESTYEVTVNVYDNTNGYNFCINKLNSNIAIATIRIARGQ